MTVVGDHLAHADFRMTSKYSHSPTDDQTKAATPLAEVLFLKGE